MKGVGRAANSKCPIVTFPVGSDHARRGENSRLAVYTQAFSRAGAAFPVLRYRSGARSSGLIQREFMEKLILFVAEQWMLVGGLLSCVMLLSFHESRRAGKQLTPHQVVSLVNQESPVLLDLRDKGDYNKGHIIDSVNLPYAKLDGEIERVVSDKSKPVVLICKLGQHSSAAGKKLAAMGYSQVYRLKGGVGEWQAMQMPLVKS